jgi:hypothetical protein
VTTWRSHHSPGPNKSIDPRDHEPVRPNSPAARPDFVALHLALARRALGIAVDIPDPDPADVEQLEWQAHAP